jgi:hypothetical protein
MMKKKKTENGNSGEGSGMEQCGNLSSLPKKRSAEDSGILGGLTKLQGY